MVAIAEREDVMEFLDVVGSRRSIRWFHPDQTVDPARIQRILEAARMTGSPGNLQPWRAVVVVQDDLDSPSRDRLLDAANRQRPHEQAPVWIYWFADPAAMAGHRFLEQISLGVEFSVLARAAGWDTDAARAAIDEGVPTPTGMPPLHQIVHGLPPEVAAILAAREVVGAITVATLAAVNDGLGTCLQVPAAPSEAATLFEVLGVPAHFVPIWLQLLGHRAESAEAGGQRPREEFADLFAATRWGTPFPRDASVTADLEKERLIQAAAPLPGRGEEVDRLARQFGYA